LVRTSRVGYLRDIRRLTVALSRARLGLYILGRREVFETVPELRQAFDILLNRPDKLQLVIGEMFGAASRTAEAEAATGLGEDGGEDNEQDIVQELDDEEDLGDVAVDGEAAEEAS
jgi:intron-binding protein aquarius